MPMTDKSRRWYIPSRGDGGGGKLFPSEASTMGDYGQISEAHERQLNKRTGVLVFIGVLPYRF